MRYLRSLSVIILLAVFAIPVQGQTVHTQGVVTIDVQGAEATPSGHAGALVTVRSGTYGVSVLGLNGKHDRSAYMGPTRLLSDEGAAMVEASLLAGVNQNQGISKLNGSFQNIAPTRSSLAFAGVLTYANGPISVTGGLTVATGLYDAQGAWYWPDWKRSNRLQRTGLLFGLGFTF